MPGLSQAKGLFDMLELPQSFYQGLLAYLLVDPIVGLCKPLLLLTVDERGGMAEAGNITSNGEEGDTDS